VVLVPRSASTLYDVYHDISNTSVMRMRITDQVMQRALAGHKNYKKNVAKAFRERVKKDYGSDPGWVEFSDLDFVVIRELDAEV